MGYLLHSAIFLQLRLYLSRCPYGCNCTGLAVDCRNAEDFQNSTISDNTKIIDISTNDHFFRFLQQYKQNLIYLSLFNMSYCGVSYISSDFFHSMRNLLILDLRHNSLKVMHSRLFSNQYKLNTLLLDGNTEIQVIEAFAFEGLLSLKHFKLSHAYIERISKDAFQSLSLVTLDLSHNLIHLIDNMAFDGLGAEYMYLNVTRINLFDRDMLAGLNISSKLFTEAYKFCCIRPQALSEENCYPHRDEFSSCEDLMRNTILRSLLWVIGLFSLLGNAAALIYRFLFDREHLKMGYGIFVSNLAIADFLMGIYLVTIASADVAFRGIYIFNDESWRNSFWCKMAGIVSTMSSEGSVLFICLITIDRILVIKYPFGQIRFSTKLAVNVSGSIWILVSLFAVFPVAITSYFEDSFYSKSGVCLALPLTRDRPPGWAYSVSIFIGFNFVTFLAIAFGQWMIYSTINSAKEKMKSCSTGRKNDLRVARNLLLVASTDFLCWFPIGVLGKVYVYSCLRRVDTF